MPVLKHSAIHCTPLKAIEYVINGDKTDECKFVSGINISTDPNDAYEEFKLNFEMYTGERFYKKSAPANGKKERIRLHHYIQSFKPGEVTAEQAHEIGQEWVRLLLTKRFSMKYQVLVCTHTDKEHIHNHILVSAVDLQGKVWHDNKETLKKGRELSDKIALANGLSIIENPRKRSTVARTEYLARKNKKSWKRQLCFDIDIAISNENVRSIDDLKGVLEELGYEISGDKYLFIKPTKYKRQKPISTYNLGDGYAMEELEFRIRYKGLFPLFSNSSEWEYDLSLFIRQSQVYLQGHNPRPAHDVSYYQARKSAELLLWIRDNNIRSIDEIGGKLNRADEKYRELMERRKVLSEKINNSSEGQDMQSELDGLDEKIRKAKTERDLIERHYLHGQNLLKTDYERIVEDIKSGKELPAETFKERLDRITKWADEVHKKAAEKERRQQFYAGRQRGR